MERRGVQGREGKGIMKWLATRNPGNAFSYPVPASLFNSHFAADQLSLLLSSHI